LRATARHRGRRAPAGRDRRRRRVAPPRPTRAAPESDRRKPGRTGRAISFLLLAAPGAPAARTAAGRPAAASARTAGADEGTGGARGQRRAGAIAGAEPLAERGARRVRGLPPLVLHDNAVDSSR